MATRKIRFDVLGAVERDGKVVVVVIETFTEDRIEFEISNLTVAEQLSDALTFASAKAAVLQAAERIDGRSDA